jgi:CO dehydrogenase nickel-insertion accessory protein CooC1
LRDYLDKRDIRVIGSIHQDQEIFESCLEGRPIQGRVAAEDVDKILDFMFP